MTLRPTSFRVFAKQMGVTLSAVQRAAASGRLSPASVGRDAKGRRVLLDPARAAQELAQHTRLWVAGNGNGHAAAAPSALARATLRERHARARAIELELARKMRQLVPAAEVELRWSALIVAARTALLGIPSRAKARLPHLSGADLLVFEGLVREVLEELAAPPAAARPSRRQPVRSDAVSGAQPPSSSRDPDPKPDH